MSFDSTDCATYSTTKKKKINEQINNQQVKKNMKRHKLYLNIFTINNISCIIDCSKFIP